MVDIKAVLIRLREKFVDALDELIEEVEDGEMDNGVDYEMNEVEDPDMAEYRRIQRQMNG